MTQNVPAARHAITVVPNLVLPCKVMKMAFYNQLSITINASVAENV
jgi:hypothetical protein